MKTIINVFKAMAAGSIREQEMISASKEDEMTQQLPAHVKVSAPGTLAVAKAQQQSKKLQRAPGAAASSGGAGSAKA
jgi:hypothetical protein